MLRIMGASTPSSSASSDARSGRLASLPWWSFACSADDSERSPGAPAHGALGDDGRVDVGEDVVLHVIAGDRPDDGPVADGHHERGAVHEDDRLARALAGGAVHAPLEALERALAELDPAAAHALERVSRELDLSGLLGKHVAERRALEGRRRGGRLLRRRDVERRRRDGARRDQRGVVRRRAHLTWVTEPASIPATPSTVSVAVPSAMSTVSTLPVFAAPLESR